VDLVREVWDAGAALFPLDHRLPETEGRSLLTRARPTVVLGDEGWTRLHDGVRVVEGEALVVHTSGTAGRPKLVRFGREAIEAAVASSALALGATRDDGWLCCLPLAHVGGLLVLLRAVLLGSPVSVHPRFDPARVAAERGAAFVSLVPTMLARLLDAGVDLSTFRTILVGGSALRRDLRARARTAGAHVVETYGLTESCGGVVYDGRPFAGTEVRIDGHGAIELRGPTLMLGYRFEPVASDAALTTDGWLRTGDAGALDASGRLRVLGRLDDLIESGGEKVWPEEVEEVLRSHPKVAQVAVSGRHDPEWGQRVVAFVAPRDSADPPTLDELREQVGGVLPRFKAPRELILLDALPTTASGKVRRALLP
jgi:O-succinylbenzoic acid--CoA ligase